MEPKQLHKKKIYRILSNFCVISTDVQVAKTLQEVYKVEIYTKIIGKLNLTMPV